MAKKVEASPVSPWVPSYSPMAFHSPAVGDRQRDTTPGAARLTLAHRTCMMLPARRAPFHGPWRHPRRCIGIPGSGRFSPVWRLRV